MNTKLMSIFTRTPLHVGCGSSVGAVDQPVSRERHTRFPVIPGSSLKGVLADLWLEVGKDVEIETDKKGNTNYVRIKDSDARKILGDNSSDNDASAGSLLIGEGKLLAFPVRSAKHCFAWITCPLVLKRFAADKRLTALGVPEKVENGKAMAPEGLRINGSVVFEEYPLASLQPVPQSIIDEFAKISGEPTWKDEVKDRLAIVSDEMFAYFAENACEIANHNRIDDVSGVVANGALFSQENVPSETMFYAVFNSRNVDDFTKLEEKLKDENNLLQIGADMTTGLGWCSVEMKEVE